MTRLVTIAAVVAGTLVWSGSDGERDAGATPVPAPARTTQPAAHTARLLGGGSTYAEQVVALVNARRVQAGCTPVHANGRLSASARAHADDMAFRNYYEHQSPEGRDGGDRIAAAGYSWTKWGENIDRGPKTPAEAMSEWMDSEDHREVILDCSLKEIGVGVNLAGNGPWWVQNFGRRR
ncbi:CAP domain-containing protein [Streptomyces sp. NPDC002889]|uniref:CAP domain-containing protein n=1 Tax=Streptomyces sp. NPDC002889 TaxID=3364669 RepID=UPI00369F970A